MSFGVRRRKYTGRRRKGYGSVKKRLVRTAGRAAVRSRMPNQMCRDLGNAFPSCMVLKVRQHVYASMGDVSAVLPNGTTATDKYYSCNFRCFPSNASVVSGNYGTFGGLAQLTTGSSIVGVPPGLARIFNTSGAAGVYQRACVLSCQYFIKCTLTRTTSASETSLPGGRWMHVLHTRDSDGETAPDMKTIALADTTWCQPDVRRRFKDTTNSGVYVIGAAAGSMNTRYPAHRLVWKHKLWPHKELDQPFTNYISQDASFAAADNIPTNRASVELRGFGTNATHLASVENQGTMDIEVIYTLLLKDPFATVS